MTPRRTTNAVLKLALAALEAAFAVGKIVLSVRKAVNAAAKVVLSTQKAANAAAKVDSSALEVVAGVREASLSALEATNVSPNTHKVCTKMMHSLMLSRTTPKLPLNSNG